MGKYKSCLRKLEKQVAFWKFYAKIPTLNHWTVEISMMNFFIKCIFTLEDGERLFTIYSHDNLFNAFLLCRIEYRADGIRIETPYWIWLKDMVKCLKRWKEFATQIILLPTIVCILFYDFSKDIIMNLLHIVTKLYIYIFFEHYFEPEKRRGLSEFSCELVIFRDE